jgi:hypothetical protein
MQQVLSITLLVFKLHSSASLVKGLVPTSFVEAPKTTIEGREGNDKLGMEFLFAAAVLGQPILRDASKIVFVLTIQEALFTIGNMRRIPRKREFVEEVDMAFITGSSHALVVASSLPCTCLCHGVHLILNGCRLPFWEGLFEGGLECRIHETVQAEEFITPTALFILGHTIN